LSSFQILYKPNKRMLNSLRRLQTVIFSLLGSLSNHDGNAKENVTLKMTSKYFKLLRDSFNSFNLSNVAEQSGS